MWPNLSSAAVVIGALRIRPDNGTYNYGRGPTDVDDAHAPAR